MERNIKMSRKRRGRHRHSDRIAGNAIQRRFDAAVSVHDVAAAIGPGLAKAALAGKVDGQLVDTSTVLNQDVDLAIITVKDAEALELLRSASWFALLVALLGSPVADERNGIAAVRMMKIGAVALPATLLVAILVFVTAPSVPGGQYASDLLTDREKHVIGLAVTMTRGCQVCTRNRVEKARNIGITDDELNALVAVTSAVNSGVTAATARVAFGMIEQDASEGPDVCTRIDCLASRLLRAHIPRRAEHRPE